MFYLLGRTRNRLIERANLKTGNLLGDGEHILYVNGEYWGNTDIGKLMHDFNCTKADKMSFELMAEKYALEAIANISGLPLEDVKTESRANDIINSIESKNYFSDSKCGRNPEFRNLPH